MKFVIILALVSVCCAYQYIYDDVDSAPNRPKYDLKDAPNLFQKFIADYGKTYKDEEDYKKHYENFVSNLRSINKMNSEGGDAVFDINMFADKGEGEDSEDGGFQ